jgi:predicted RNA methylase
VLAWRAGILSLLAARAGAARVFAVEAGPMAEHLPQIAAQNGFADVITVFHCAVEDVECVHRSVRVLVARALTRLVAGCRRR